MVTWPRRPNRLRLPASRSATSDTSQSCDRTGRMATSKITAEAGWSSRCTVRSKRSSTTSISDSRRSKRRVLTTPEITTCRASMLRTRAIGMKIRCRANSSTTRPLTRGARPSARRCTHDVAHPAHLVPGIVEDRQVPDPRDEDRGRRCRHGVIISSDGILASMIEFKDLCLDVTDPEVAAKFWGPALGLRPESDNPQPAGRRGARPHAVAQPGARAAYGQAAGASGCPRRRGVRSPRPGGHGAGRHPALDGAGRSGGR